MRVRLGNTHFRSPFFLFMSHCRWTCVSHAESDTSSDLQGANDFLGLVEHAQFTSGWEEMQADVSDLEELSTESAFITEDMLQSISTGGSTSVTNSNLNNTPHSNQGCRFVFGSNTSLRNVLIAQQHGSNCIVNNGQVNSGANSNTANDDNNQMLDVCVNGNVVANSNRSSVESKNSNNMLYEFQRLHSAQQYHSQKDGRQGTNEPYQNSVTSYTDDQRNTGTQIYENVPVAVGNQRTIEVSGVTNTSSSDSCVQGSHNNRESDISMTSDLSGAALEIESCLTDSSGATGGSEVNNQTDQHPPDELSDILFRFDRQFRVNTGFGFANWRWPHRLSNQTAGSGGEGASAATSENTLQKQARWLRRLQMHRSTATPSNSSFNSLRSNSSDSSSSVSGANLQQEWYFYDPRLVPQHRTERLAVRTDHNRIQTTSYLSSIVNPPTYDELINMPGNRAHYRASSGILPNLPEAPPPPEDTQMMQPMIVSDSGTLPSEPPPPYMGMELPPVYDLDPSVLTDPPPQYDDHSFNGDDLPHDPMDPSPLGQVQNDNFILTQATTMTSETDRNFILSAVPHLRSASRQDVSIPPDSQSILSENDTDVMTSQSDIISSDNVEDNNLPEIERNTAGIDQEEESGSCIVSVPLHRPLPLEELFRDPNISETDMNPIDLDTEQVTDECDLSNTESQTAVHSLPGQPSRNQSSAIFPGYQLLHNSPELPLWSRLGRMSDDLANEADDNLDDVTHDLVDDFPDQHEDNSRSLANFPNDNYPAGFVSGNRPPLRWSRGMGLGRWNSQNWAI